MKVKAHDGSAGNERADKLAKEASKFAKEQYFPTVESMLERPDTPIVVSDSMNECAPVDQWKQRRENELQAYLRGWGYSQIMRAVMLPSNSIPSSTRRLHKTVYDDYFWMKGRHAGIINRLRCEHVDLKQFRFYKFNDGPSPCCDECSALLNSRIEESVNHFLLRCKRFDVERVVLQRKLQSLNPFFANWERVCASDILFPFQLQNHPARGSRGYCDKYAELQNQRLAIYEAVANFVHATKRFENANAV